MVDATVEPTVDMDGSGAVLGRTRGETPMRRQHRALRTAAWYVVLTLLSVIVLFPVYMTLVRALSRPVEYFNAGSPLRPVSIDWGVFRRAWNEGDLAGPMLRSLVVTLIITVHPAGHRHHGGLRLRLPRLPVQAGDVRAVHVHPPVAHRGHAHRQQRDDPVTAAGPTATRASSPRSLPRRSAPSSSGRGSSASRTRSGTPPASTATATSRSSPGSPCRSPGR